MIHVLFPNLSFFLLKFKSVFEDRINHSISEQAVGHRRRWTDVNIINSFGKPEEKFSSASHVFFLLEGTRTSRRNQC